MSFGMVQSVDMGYFLYSYTISIDYKNIFHLLFLNLYFTLLVTNNCITL